MDFVALDFETANPRRSSICQVGIAEFSGGACTSTDSWLVDPAEEFNRFCVRIHGITAEKVRGKPLFPKFYEEVLKPRLDGRVVVCHSDFDRQALTKACAFYQSEEPDVLWLDSAALARRVWPEEVLRGGAGLKNLAATKLGVEFRHHDAVEDAKVAGLVFVAAAKHLGLGLDGCIELLGPKRPAGLQGRARSTHTIAPAEPPELSRLLAALVENSAAGTEGVLADERVVISGRLQIPKEKVGSAIKQLGGYWEKNVTSKTTMLVIGSYAEGVLKGREKSEKHEKAATLIATGHEI